MRHFDVQDPMLATLGKPPTRYADFAVEAKYGGQRGMADRREWSCHAPEP